MNFSKKINAYAKKHGLCRVRILVDAAFSDEADLGLMERTGVMAWEAAEKCFDAVQLETSRAVQARGFAGDPPHDQSLKKSAKTALDGGEK